MDPIELPRPSSVFSVELAQRPLANGRPRLIAARSDAEAVITWLREYQDSPHTFSNYRKEAERLLLWCEGRGQTLAGLGREDVLDYQQFLGNPQPAERWIGPARPRQHPDWRPFTGALAASSVRQAMTILGALFQYLLDAGYLNANPLALARRSKRALQGPPTVERYLEESSWHAVLDTLDALPQHGPRDIQHCERARWLLHLLYLTGARRSEVAQAVMGDWFQRKGLWWWRVVGKGNKQGDIPVSTALLAALQRYRQHCGLSDLPSPGEPTPLVGRVNRPGALDTLSDKAIYLIVKQVFRLAAERHPALADTLLAASTHWLRHTAASHQLEAGVPLLVVSQNLRHSTIQTTRRYLHTEDDARHQASQLHGLRRPE